MDKEKYLKYKTKYLNLKSSIINNEFNNNKFNNNLVGGRKKMKYKVYNNKLYHKSYTNMEENSIRQYNENLSEPWFSLISLGLKTVEGRKNKGKFKDMKVGEIITWENNDFLPRKIKTRIIGKTEYNTFEEYLSSEGLNKCLPGINDMDTGLSVYYKYYTKEDEQKYGVIAIKLELV